MGVVLTYLRIGALVAFLGVALVALWYRGEAASAVAERDRARADLAVAVDANNAAQATIGRLRASAEADDRLNAQIAADIEAIRRGQAETNDGIDKLTETNADVAAYLHGAVPPDLRKLLDR